MGPLRIGEQILRGVVTPPTDGWGGRREPDWTNRGDRLTDNPGFCRVASWRERIRREGSLRRLFSDQFEWCNTILGDVLDHIPDFRRGRLSHENV